MIKFSRCILLHYNEHEGVTHSPLIPCSFSCCQWNSWILRTLSQDILYILQQIPSTEDLAVSVRWGWHCLFKWASLSYIRNQRVLNPSHQLKKTCQQYVLLFLLIIKTHHIFPFLSMTTIAKFYISSCAKWNVQGFLYATWMVSVRWLVKEIWEWTWTDTILSGF